MKILVTAKSVLDSDQRIQVREDGRSIDTSGIPLILNPFDAIAVEEALRIRERLSSETEIVVVGVGPAECEQQLRTALAMGADRALLLRCDQTLDPWSVCQILTRVVRDQQPDLVLMGKQAVDDDAGQVGQFLAARLSWPQATFASSIELVEDRLRVQRETDYGIETVTVPLPAVVTCDLRLNEPRYASLPNIMRARKKPVETIDVAQLGLEIGPRVEVISLQASDAHRSCEMLTGVGELARKLRDLVGSTG